MEIITKYKATDGTEFFDKEKCEKYESLIEQVNSVMSALPARPNNIKFLDGHTYIQHDKRILRETKISLLEICKKYITHDWIQQSIEDDNIHPSWVGRLLSDSDIEPLIKAWHRFECIDTENREWGRVSLSENPNLNAKMICSFTK